MGIFNLFKKTTKTEHAESNVSKRQTEVDELTAAAAEAENVFAAAVARYAETDADKDWAARQKSRDAHERAAARLAAATDRLNKASAELAAAKQADLIAERDELAELLKDENIQAAYAPLAERAAPHYQALEKIFEEGAQLYSEQWAAWERGKKIVEELKKQGVETPTGTMAYQSLSSHHYFLKANEYLSTALDKLIDTDGLQCKQLNPFRVQRESHFNPLAHH